MKGKTIILVVLIGAFLVLGFRSLWDIDIAMGSALTNGRIITGSGFQDFNIFYHRALIMNLVSYLGLMFMSLFLYGEYMQMKGGSR